MKRLVEEAVVRFQEPVAPRLIYSLRLRSPAIAAAVRPGQFVHIRVSSGFDPLLRRPISIHSVAGEEIELIYRVVGRGTEILAGLRPGAVLDLLGPIGRGFDLEPDKTPLMIGGGLGVPPIHYLAQDLATRGGSGLVLLGFRGLDDAYAVEELEALPGLEVKTATEDGSLGHKGLLTELLPSGPELDNRAVYACGPTPMLAAVAAWAEENGLPCQVSLEERMGCGLGACLGCTVPVLIDDDSDNPIKYRRVCTDGPVFPASTINWKELTGGL
ncbi:dihydroorotate dehydrogenase electron transfer subunit [candidate division KSB1 bacterium]